MRTNRLVQSILLLFALGAFAGGAQAAGGACGDVRCLDPKVDLDNQPSLQRGAKLFVNYCLSCHQAAFMRYNRMGRDLGLTDDQLEDNLMLAAEKSGQPMEAAMRSEDARKWFGTSVPDLSVISRARGAPWLYTYLMTFYRDDSRLTGANNLVFKEVAMPHVLGDLQGVQVRREQADGSEGAHGPSSVNDMLELVSPGTLSPNEYRTAARDLTAFLVYMGEPAKLVRYKVGFWVLVFLVVLYLLSRSLYKEYWRDVH